MEWGSKQMSEVEKIELSLIRHSEPAVAAVALHARASRMQAEAQQQLAANVVSCADALFSVGVRLELGLESIAANI